MHDYTVALALFDYLPIAFTTLGMYWLCQSQLFDLAAIRKLAIAGAVLVISGGLLKASWKLIVASSGTHIVWMNNSLFILMAPGFVLLSCALLLSHKKERHTYTVSLWAPTLIATAILVIAYTLSVVEPAQKLWFFWLLTVVTLGNTVTIFLLAKVGWNRNDKVISLLYILSFAGTLTLSGLARIPDQTAALQWIEESINAAAQGLFFVASLRLNKRLRETDTP